MYSTDGSVAVEFESETDLRDLHFFLDAEAIDSQTYKGLTLTLDLEASAAI